MKPSIQLIFITITLFPFTTVSLAAEKPNWGQQHPNDISIDKWNSLKASVTSEIKLTAGDATASDLFGNSVSISGDRALIGAFDDNGKTGSAYVFIFDGINWVQEQKLTASDAAVDDRFGISVSLSGNRALIGAFNNDDDGNNSGSAYVFEFNGLAWEQEQILTADDASSLDRFGYSTSLMGDRALIGAYNDFGNTGSAYVFEFNGINWVEEQKLKASDGVQDDWFGYSVSLSGDRALIGAYNDDIDDGSNFGSAYVFEFDGVVWEEEQKLTASDGAANDHFGNSVSLSGDRALIGAFYDFGQNTGSAYVFKFDGVAWEEEQKLTASDGAANDQFGISVSLSGGRALIGAPHGDTGLAYIFEFDGINWGEEQKLIASDGAAEDRFGISVGLSGDRILIGAYRDDDDGTNSGSAYVFLPDIIFYDGFEAD